MNFLSSIAAAVKETTVSLILEDEEESEESESVQEAPVPILPWKEVDVKHEEEVKSRILALSMKKQPFVTKPPTEANFPFVLEEYLPLASLLLKADPELEKTRFWLCPKYVREVPFWRNYFYQITLIKDAYPLRTVNHSVETSVGDRDDDEGSNSDELEAKAIKTTITNNTSILDEPLTTPHDIPVETHTVQEKDKDEPNEIIFEDIEQEDWEKELEEELERELSQEVGM